MGRNKFLRKVKTKRRRYKKTSHKKRRKKKGGTDFAMFAEKRDRGLEKRLKLQTERDCIGWKPKNTQICVGEKDGNHHEIQRSMFKRDYHHCRNCGQQVCKEHSKHDLIIFRYAIGGGSTRALRSCDKCFLKEKEIIQQIQTYVDYAHFCST